MVGAEACVFECKGCPDALAHYSVCEVLWPPLFYAFQLRGDRCLAAAIAIAAGGSPSEVKAAAAVLCAASETFRIVRHISRRRRIATQDALRACVWAVCERAWLR